MICVVATISATVPLAWDILSAGRSDRENSHRTSPSLFFDNHADQRLETLNHGSTRVVVGKTFPQHLCYSVADGRVVRMTGDGGAGAPGRWR